MGIVVKNKIKLGKRASNFTPIPDGEFSRPIQFKENLIYKGTVVYTNDDFGLPMTPHNLADISTINNFNGVPTGVPANSGVGINHYDMHGINWYNINGFKIYIDLEVSYNLDYVYIWGPIGKSVNLKFYASEDGTTVKPLTDKVNIYDAGLWTKVEFTQTANKGGNKYFIISNEYNEQSFQGLVLYGRPSTGAEKLNVGVKAKRKVRQRTNEESTGTNGFFFENAEFMEPVSGVHRFYVVPEWYMERGVNETGAMVGKPLSDWKFEFDNSHMGSFDQLLQSHKNAGTKVMFDSNQSPNVLRPIGTTDPTQSKTLDPGFSTTNISHTTNPLNYTYVARMAWNLAARYGANKNADPQFVQLAGDQPVRLGLDLVEVFEIGNEMDKWWAGAQGYHNPEEMAAYMSAIYDGHKGAMGPGFGIKDADPSMRVSLVSFASGDDILAMRRLLWWFDKYRGVGDYPFDLINYHWYNSSAGSQTVTDGSGAYGIPPETGLIMPTNQMWSDLRDRYFQSGEIWLTECGYDEHNGGVFSPRKITQFERSRCKAYWLTRMFMCNQISGVDVSCHYWFANQGGVRFLDLPENEANPGKFLSCGLTDGVQDSSDFNRVPLMSYWYMANFKNTLKGFTFQHAVMMDGVHSVEENLFTNASSNIWAAAYYNYVTEESIIAVWLRTSDFISEQATLNVSSTSVEVINMDNAEIRKSVNGVSSIMDSPGNKLTLTVTECPQFIKTSILGTPKLKPVEDVKTQRINGTNINITWYDKNLGSSIVKISRSLTPVGGFSVLFQGENNRGSYVDSGLNPFTNYFYQVEFVRDTTIILPPDPEEPVDPEDPEEPEVPTDPGTPPVEGVSQKLTLAKDRFFVLDKYDDYIDPMIDGVTSNTTPVLGYSMKTNPCQIYYDFGKNTPNRIQKIRIYDGSGSYNIKVYGVAPGTFARTLLLNSNNENYGQWNEFLISNSGMCRYLLIEVENWNIPAEMEVFGSFPQAPVITSPAIKKTTLKAVTGVNGFEWNWIANPYKEDERNEGVYQPKVDLFKDLGNFRQYIDWEKIERAEGKFTFNPTYNGGWKYDIIYATAKANGMTILPCFQKIPEWIMDTWPVEKRLNDNIPVKYPASFDIPQSFVEYGRAAFQIAARYGSNSNISPSLIKIDTEKPNSYTDANEIKIGLNTLSYIEANNEPDRWWRDYNASTGRNSYMTGREYCASLSAYYDGHKNSMGAGVGAKNADPNMKIVMAGIASDRTDYVKGMISWAEEHRGYLSNGKIDLPFDVINWHFYPSDATSQGNSTRGVAPEKANWDGVIGEFNKLRNYKEDLELWISEIGYDDVNTSDIFANPIGNKTSRQVVADWTLRISLLAARTGVSRIFFFQIFDEGKVGRFNSSGFFIEEVVKDETTTPPTIISVELDRKPSGNFQVQLAQQFGSYVYDSTISNNPHVDKYTQGSNVMYAAWVPDEIGRTASYNLTVPAGTTSATKYVFDYNSIVPTTQSVNAVGNQIPLVLTETPVFIKL